MTDNPIVLDQPRPLDSDSALALTGPALRDVIAHRLAQIEVHGYDREHDAGETPDALVAGAGSYVIAAAIGLSQPVALSRAPNGWPWDAATWKPGPPRRMLVKAAALILAAIDRIDADTQPDQRQPVAGGASPFPEAGGDAPVPSTDQRRPAADGASPSTVCGDAPPASGEPS